MAEITEPISQETLRELVWRMETIVYVGPRGCGKSSLAKAVRLLAPSKIIVSDSSRNISCDEPDDLGFVQTCPQTLEARILSGSVDAQSRGLLQPTPAVMAANIVMTRRRINKCLTPPHYVLAPGMLREPAQWEDWKALSKGRTRIIHIRCSEDETFEGAEMREFLGEKRTDASYSSLKRAWAVYAGPVLDMIKLIEDTSPKGTILTLDKSNGPLVSTEEIVDFMSPPNHVLRDWQSALDNTRHPARIKIDGIIDDIKRFREHKHTQSAPAEQGMRRYKSGSIPVEAQLSA